MFESFKLRRRHDRVYHELLAYATDLPTPLRQINCGFVYGALYVTTAIIGLRESEGFEPLVGERSTVNESSIRNVYATIISFFAVMFTWAGRSLAGADHMLDWILTNPRCWPHLESLGFKDIVEVIALKKAGPDALVDRTNSIESGSRLLISDMTQAPVAVEEAMSALDDIIANEQKPDVQKTGAKVYDLVKKHLSSDSQNVITMMSFVAMLGEFMRATFESIQIELQKVQSGDQ